jgi:hypothetical protein
MREETMSESELRERRKLDWAFAAVAIAVALITFLKGFRMPNAWAATHFAFNYSQGFVRRGLVGEIARQIGGDDVFQYNPFALVSFLVLLGVGVALGFAVRQALRSDPSDHGFRVAVLAFAASPAMVFFVHSVGYFEDLAILLILPLILFAHRLRNRYVIFYIVLLLGLLFAFVHEVLVVMFGPVFVFAFACHIVRDTRRYGVKPSRLAVLIAHAVVITAIIFVVAMIVSTLGSDDAARIRGLQRFLRQHADFPIRAESFQALGRSSHENLTKLMPWYWEMESSRELASRTWIAYLPGFAFFLYYGVWAISRPALPRRLTWMFASLYVAVTISAHFLNLVGWDWNRWNAITLFAGLLSLLFFKRYFRTRSTPRSPAHVWALGAIAAALGLAGDYQLNDGFKVQFYPFDKQFDTMENLVKKDFKFRPRR